MLSSLANPVSYAIGRQGIAIPIQHAISGSAGEVDQATTLYSAQTTKSELTFGDMAFVGAQFAGNTVMLARWFAWKTEFLASVLVNGFNVWLGAGEFGEQAISTNADGS
jgi:hypothetical protein